jgi:hypothetical protein
MDVQLAYQRIVMERTIALEDLAELSQDPEQLKSFVSVLFPGTISMEEARVRSGMVSERMLSETKNQFLEFWGERKKRILQRKDGFLAMVEAELKSGLMEKAIDRVGKPYVQAKPEDKDRYKHSNLASHVSFKKDGQMLDMEILHKTATYFSGISVKDLTKIQTSAIQAVEKGLDNLSFDPMTVLAEFNDRVVKLFGLEKGTTGPKFLLGKKRTIYHSDRFCGDYRLYYAIAPQRSGLFAISSDTKPYAPDYVPLLTAAQVSALKEDYLAMETVIEEISAHGLDAHNDTSELIKTCIRKLQQTDEKEVERRKHYKQCLLVLTDIHHVIIYVNIKLATYLNSTLSGYMQGLLYFKRIAKGITGLE